jgi:hypothetical protein
MFEIFITFFVPELMQTEKKLISFGFQTCQENVRSYYSLKNSAFKPVKHGTIFFVYSYQSNYTVS